jgi:RNA polymerase sigma-70 factor (ECF subfamily)
MIHTAGTERTIDLEEAGLVRAARGGDARAYESLYRRHVGRVYALCRRMTDATRGEDLTQEVFIRAWERLSSFDGRSAFATWLHRVAVNLAIDALRREATRAGRETRAPEEALTVAAPARPAGGSADLEAAVASLPPGARAVFVLHDVEGYRHEEIAALTGMAAGTSRAHLHRARRLLREKLER